MTIVRMIVMIMIMISGRISIRRKLILKFLIEELYIGVMYVDLLNFFSLSFCLVVLLIIIVFLFLFI